MGDRIEPFIGSQALARGKLNRHQLRARYRRVLPDVYVPRFAQLSLEDRIAAAWVWSRGRATIAGLAAAALHGARWIDDDIPIELVHENMRPPRGVMTRRDVLIDDEVQMLTGRAVTTAQRTAFDIGRRGSVLAAVARLDALAKATGLQVDDVAELAGRHRGARGLRHLETVLDLVDEGAQSPKETWLRLVLIQAGFPRPQTQIPVLGPDGMPMYYLDVGWEDLRIAAEYEGDHHRIDRAQFASDIHRLEYVERERGWLVVRLTAEDRRADVIRRVGRAFGARQPGARQPGARQPSVNARRPLCA
jgi:hypothetical protein